MLYDGVPYCSWRIQIVFVNRFTVLTQEILIYGTNSLPDDLRSKLNPTGLAFTSSEDATW